MQLPILVLGPQMAFIHVAFVHVGLWNLLEGLVHVDLWNLLEGLAVLAPPVFILAVGTPGYPWERSCEALNPCGSKPSLLSKLHLKNLHPLIRFYLSRAEWLH